MVKATLYTRAGCHLCEAAHDVLERARARAALEIELVDIDGDEALRREFNEEVPVVALNGRVVFRHAVDEAELLKRLT